MSSTTLPIGAVDSSARAHPRRGLGPRMIVYILLFSSVVTFFATGFQLYLDYVRDVRAIDGRIAQVERSNLNSIRLSLWSMDNEQLRAQLEGILALPDIQYLEIRSHERAVLSVGTNEGRNLIREHFPITYTYRGSDVDLGTLHVVASLDGVYRRLLDKVIVIFATQAVKTLLVASFIFFLFQWLITRHLGHISRFVRTRGFQNPGEILTLSRRKQESAEPDELDDVVRALNDMWRSLESSYDQLRSSEERFDLAMRGANDGLWDWNMRANRVYYSPRWKEMLGYRDDEMADNLEAWRERIHTDDMERTVSELKRHLRGDCSQFESIHRLRHRDGSYRWILSRGQALRDDDDMPYRLVGTHMDITRQKETEAALERATEELREEHERRVQAERLACVGELAASIAHEIRNPLASIVNCLTLIELDSMEPEERDTVMNIVNDETRRLQRILVDFLDFARIKAAEPMPTDLIPIITETIEAISVGCRNGAAIEVNTKFHSPLCIVQIDSDQIRQVLWNLMLNSIQAMPDGGRLSVSTRAEAGRVWVSVHDNGPGIPEELRQRIMDPFVTGREDGTGLGLAIVQRILVQHGSSLLMESESGHGTEVQFDVRLV